MWVNSHKQWHSVWVHGMQTCLASMHDSPCSTIRHRTSTRVLHRAVDTACTGLLGCWDDVLAERLWEAAGAQATYSRCIS